MAGVHLDSAACSRQSFSAIDAADAHARHEAEVGGYVATAAAQPVLDAGRAAIGVLTGLTPDDVVFTTGSGDALDLLLGSWPGERTLACPPGEYGPNLAIMAANGFRVRALPVDDLGRVDVEGTAAALRGNPPALVHLTGIASHRGVVQPMGEVVEVCRAAGVPLVLDAAQAFGQIDCAVGADAVYSSSRKWMAGPRGVGFLAVRPELGKRLTRRIPPADWPPGGAALPSFEHREANIAARIGYSVALGEHLAVGPQRIRQRLALIGRASRALLDGVGGWRVVEPADTPTAITTLVPPDGIDPVQLRLRLIDEHRLVTTAAEIAAWAAGRAGTAAEIARAPFELSGPVLRVSPHVDVSGDDLAALRSVLCCDQDGYR